MSDQLMLPAETRDRAGKGASRLLRREGRVPAVVYGQKQDPLSIHVDEKALMKMLSTGHFMNSVIMVELGGKPTRTLPKAVDFHPVSSRPVHVDFTLTPAPGYSDSTGVVGEGGQMLHWKSKLMYLAVVAAIVIAAAGGEFEGWAW